MSHQRKEGKDTIIFLSKEESDEPTKVTLEYDKDDEEQMGLIRPDGEINWNCPCLQGMADGPCGTEFKESFSCFHFSEADPKGSDCIDKFRSMQECFMKHPEVYSFDDDKEVSLEDPNSSGGTSQPDAPNNDEKTSAENVEEDKIEEAKEVLDNSDNVDSDETENTA